MVTSVSASLKDKQVSRETLDNIYGALSQMLDGIRVVARRAEWPVVRDVQGALDRVGNFLGGQPESYQQQAITLVRSRLQYQFADYYHRYVARQYRGPNRSRAPA